MVIIRNLIFTVHFVHGFHFVHPFCGLNNLHLVRFFVLMVVYAKDPLSVYPRFEHEKHPPLKLLTFFTMLMTGPTVNPVGGADIHEVTCLDSVACIDRDAT